MHIKISHHSHWKWNILIMPHATCHMNSLLYSVAILTNNTMPTIHYRYLQSKLQSSCCSRRATSLASKDDQSLNVKEGGNPASSLCAPPTPTCQSKSIEISDVASNSANASPSSTIPQGSTQGLKNERLLCVEHEATKRTARKKQTKKICSADGCTKFVQSGGVCFKHGAKVKARRCKIEGCTHYVVNGGVCVRHGATRKNCSMEGCSNNAQQGGVCIKHGSKKYRYACSVEGCTHHSANGGVCKKHGAKKYLCSSEGCTSRAQQGGVCIRHGAKKYKYLCTSEGCTKQARKGGLCFKHGANLKRCIIIM